MNIVIPIPCKFDFNQTKIGRKKTRKIVKVLAKLLGVIPFQMELGYWNTVIEEEKGQKKKRIRSFVRKEGEKNVKIVNDAAGATTAATTASFYGAKLSEAFPKHVQCDKNDETMFRYVFGIANTYGFEEQFVAVKKSPGTR
ncbi:hypothetical protein M0802_003333 [Mischocyttarus mexicanus]|nr:hypothetical protein M0802_003333 [Mischocyttarus mexicanus]